MAQRFFTFDPKKCFGCHGCTAACKLGRGLPPAVSWRWVEKLPPHAGASDLTFISNACCHCSNPECLRRCPAGAYVNRKAYCIVIHLDNRCMGCRYCKFLFP
jgi:Fe-S-cluster-containing dehydrogenase component